MACNAHRRNSHVCRYFMILDRGPEYFSLLRAVDLLSCDASLVLMSDTCAFCSFYAWCLICGDWVGCSYSWLCCAFVIPGGARHWSLRSCNTREAVLPVQKRVT